MIEIRRIGTGDPLQFAVRVRDGTSETRHQVTITRETCASLAAGGKYSPEECLEASFRFLLDREPKEAILERFDVAVISRYFPDFEHLLPAYLAHA